MQLNQKFDAVKNVQKKCSKKIDIFEKFIDMKYFDDIEGHEMTVNRVRSKIRQTLTNYFQIVFDSTLFIFFIIPIFFMSSDLVFAFDSSSSKKSKVLPESKKMKLIVVAMKKIHRFVSPRSFSGSAVQFCNVDFVNIALQHNSSRSVSCFLREKKAILFFINQFIELNFSSRFFIIRKKITFFFQKSRN